MKWNQTGHFRYNCETEFGNGMIYPSSNELGNLVTRINDHREVCTSSVTEAKKIVEEMVHILEGVSLHNLIMIGEQALHGLHDRRDIKHTLGSIYHDDHQTWREICIETGVNAYLYIHRLQNGFSS